MTTVAAFGTWRSPITADLVAHASVRLSEPWPAGEETYWLEARPEEGGRSVLVRSDVDRASVDVTPSGMNVRTRVHEYGGGSFWVHGDVVWFTEFSDQRIYRLERGSGPVAITADPPSPGSIRYADGRISPDGGLIVCIRERHEKGKVINELVALPSDGSREPWVITGGHDFYSSPRISADGGRVAWLSWDQPQMPWDGTELWVADLLTPGTLGEPRLVAGGPTEAVVQPEWSDEGVLHFVSDRTGWWNLYRLADEADGPIHRADAEFAEPAWQFAYSGYDFVADRRLACRYTPAGEDRIAMLDPETSDLLDMDVPYTAFGRWLRADGSRIVFVGASATIPPQVVSLDLTTGAVDVLRGGEHVPADPTYFSVPFVIEFPTADNVTAFALFYPPASAEHVGPDRERPPLVVMSHGGPTSRVTSTFDLEKQYFTSRGLAVVDVNYGGSTGYGRKYRERLKSRWGVVDVEDCANAALDLVRREQVDRDRLAIRGGSAGGYTTLCALTFRDEFAVGASYYGVSDLVALARDTHKFESRYLDGLIGPYPEAADVYRARSPIHFVERLSCPIILLQGLDDEVVPPSQAEMMINALRAKGLQCAYLAFEGEQHGFRRAETIRRALEAELDFYARILGFDLADPVEPVPIENLEAGPNVRDSAPGAPEVRRE